MHAAEGVNKACLTVPVTLLDGQYRSPASQPRIQLPSIATLTSTNPVNASLMVALTRTGCVAR